MINLLASTGTINLLPNASSGFSTLPNVTIPRMVASLLTIVLIVAAIVFFFMLVIGGIKWILSGGDKGSTESARSTVTSALIGLVVVFAAWAIAQLLGSLFGITVFDFNIPNFLV
jgi:hypothetical protein